MAFASKLALEISMPKKANVHFIFVDGRQYIPKEALFAISDKTKQKFDKIYPLLAKNYKPTFEFSKNLLFYANFYIRIAD